MQRGCRRLAIALAGGLWLGSPVTAQAPPGSRAVPAPWEDFLAFLTSEIARCRSAYADPGLAIALVDAQGTTWSAAFGQADRERGRPVEETTLFELGSVSKLFTCAAVLQLRDRGLVDLDRPVGHYLPGFRSVSRFPEGAEAITVRMLMTHHSGLMADDDAWETTVPARHFHRAVFDYVQDKPLLFPPGQRMHYSSFGVNLLGLLVERVSGMEFARYMRERLFLPLDMPGASFDIQDLPAGRLATAYNYNPVWDRIPLDEIRPAGSLRAPVAEVAHFASMLLAGGVYGGRRVLARASVEEMTTIQNRDNVLDGNARVGLGFMAEPAFLKTGPQREIAILYHFGQARTKSLLLVVPAWQQGLVVSGNDYAVTDAAYDLFARIRRRYLDALFASQGQRHGAHPPVPDRAEEPGPPAGLAGDYASTHGLRTLVQAQGALATDSGETTFVPLVDGSFTTEPWVFPRVLYRFEPGGVLATIDGYPVDRWERLGPPDLPAALTGCAGTYAPPEGSGLSPIVLRESRGRLLLEAPQGGTFPFRFTRADRAEVVNGARSGCFGAHFIFKPHPEGLTFDLVDGLGATTYRQRP